MSEVIRKAIIELAIRQTDTKLRAPDLGPIFKPVQEFEKKATTSFENVGDEVDELGRGIESIRPKLDEISRASEATQRQLTDDSLKASEGFRTAGEGAFTFARGIAFVGSSSDEEFQKMIQTVAKVQGGFDLFKGSIDVVKGLTEGTRALSAVTSTAAVAETGLAAANTKVAVTGAVATTSMRGLLLTLGPIALAATAVGAAFLFFKDAPGDIDDMTDAFERQRKKLDGIANIKLQAIGLQLEFGDLDPEDQIKQLRNRLEEENEKLRRDAHQQKVDADRKVREARDAEIDFPFEGEGRLFKQAQTQKAIADQKRVGIQLELDLLGKKLATEEQIKAVNQSQLGVLKQKSAAIQIAMDNSREDLQIAEERVAFEKGLLQTFEERFGALDAVDKLEAKRAARILKEKGVKGLNREQVELLGRVGGGIGEAALSKFRLQSAEQAGVGGVQEDLLGATQGPLQEFIQQQRKNFGDKKFPVGLGVNFQDKIQGAQDVADIAFGELAGEPGQIEILEGQLQTIQQNKNKIVEVVSELISIEEENRRRIDELQVTIDALNN